MIQLILLVIALAVVIGFAFDHYHRSMARAEADRIISSQQPPTHKQIHKIPNVLLRTKSWTRAGTERDYRRVVQLYQMRYEMRNSQLQAHSAKVREQADRVISGKEQATEEQIDKIIVGLSFPKSWPQHLIAQDHQRLQQLQNMHNAMVKSRVQAYRAMVRAQADLIISGKEQATKEQITEIITSLQCATPWPEVPDRTHYQRIQQLHKIRNEIQKSRSRKYRAHFFPAGFLPHTDLRARAKQLIAGEQPAGPMELDLIITDFQLLTKRAQHTIDQNRQLLEQLQGIRDEMPKSHSPPPWAPQDPNLFEVQPHQVPIRLPQPRKSSGKTR